MKLCEECRKEAASVFLTLAVNNKVREVHLCSVCAARKGVWQGTETGAFNSSDIVGNLSGYFKDFLPAERKALRCGACGLTYAKFKQSGRLGCPDCYQSFEPQLTELMLRIHGSSSHTGRTYSGPGAPPPSRAEAARRAATLKTAIQEAVKKEDFETAAKLRDALKQLEGRDG
ncbi:MAG TPA: hypothetical protein DCZ92_05475 [Elusimicrobia bacterium]|nr:MAG: hypothetical protein A2016_11640 [Elusimicrobia bacterium GWF2_62_30]HBA60256.1 hypothetical protein [Elusimicrobiota bacterium]